MADRDAEQIHQELQRLQPEVERIAGMSSRWNGILEIVETQEFNGKKPFACHILISSRLIGSDLRWRTLIHELLHSVSAGYNSSDYNDYLGWEEGVVEQLQRLYRQEILSHLTVQIDETVTSSWETEWAFNRFISALEEMRVLLDVEQRFFYRALLNTPIKDRIAFVLQHSRGLPPDKKRAFIAAFSAANSVLTRGTR